MMPVPLLILSDSPSSTSGLGRICRDLALRLHRHCSDIFRVATFGYGASGSKDLPFPQYYMTAVEEWRTPDLPDVWQDFARKQPGVIFTIWDPSRMLWFSRPELGTCVDPRLRQFLNNAPVAKWGYFAIDAVGPNGQLSCMLRESIKGYDRVLCYSDWAAAIAGESLGEQEFEKRYGTFLPHGIDTSVFKPQDRSEARRIFHHTLVFKGPPIEDNERIIGVVATNQTRKDWGLAAQIIAELKRKFPVRLYIQTDTLERHWSLPGLLVDFGLTDLAIVNSVQVSDEVMSWIYSACDITLGIGAGEGFGYPIFESLACGCPVLTGSYGGHTEWLSKKYLVHAIRLHLEGIYNCFRPIHDFQDWVRRLNDLRIRPLDVAKSLLPEDLDWNSLWPKWEMYFRRAHQTLSLQRDHSPVAPNTLSEKGKDSEDSGSPPVVYAERQEVVANDAVSSERDPGLDNVWPPRGPEYPQ